MQLLQKDQADLKRHFKKVLETPAGFAFFLAIHDFVQHIEIELSLSEAELPVKYDQLKQIYQGVKDAATHSEEDLGHERYMIIQSLQQIQRKDVSDSNPLWKKREVLRKWAEGAYKAILENGQVAVAEKA